MFFFSSRSFVINCAFHNISKTYIYINTVAIEHIYSITTILKYLLMSCCNKMPTLTIYLTNELYDKVKNSPSKIVRTALEEYFNERNKNSETSQEVAEN